MAQLFRRELVGLEGEGREEIVLGQDMLGHASRKNGLWWQSPSWERGGRHADREWVVGHAHGDGLAWQAPLGGGVGDQPW